MSKTRAASKTSKTTSAWWLASNLRSIHLANKCQVNHKHDRKLDGPGKKAEFPQNKPGSPIANCWLPTTSQLHFLALHKLEQFKTRLSKSCATAIGVDIWAISQITLPARLVVLAPCHSTLKVAFVQWARLGWRPRQAKPPVHGGWRLTWEVFTWPTNIRSTIS